MNENISFFTQGYGHFRNLDLFKQSWTYRYLESIFGEMVAVYDREFKFIGVDKSGHFFNEIYYPKNHQNIYSLVPVSMIRNQFRPKLDSDVWKQVDEQGYSIIANYNPELEPEQRLWTDDYPTQISDTMKLPWYVDRINYDEPHKSWMPDHINELSMDLLKGCDIFDGKYIRTTDSIKYLYKEANDEVEGPYSYHMDYMNGLYSMIFTYHSSNPQIDGRDLLIAKRDLSSLDFQSKEIDKKALSKNITANAITTCDRINISPDKIIIMNSINPVFVHAVDKLKSENEVILLTHYIWS